MVFMRFVAAAIGLMITVSASAQDLSVRVTYTTRAARAARVLRDLERLAGVALRISPDVENEVLIVSVKDEPLSEVISRIAIATSGEWRHEGAALRLVASLKVRRQEERAELAKRVAGIKHSIEELTSGTGLDLNSILSSQSSVGSSSDRKTDHDLLAKVAGVVGIEELAQTGPSRVVYSTQPTQMQRSLDPSVLDLVTAGGTAGGNPGQVVKVLLIESTMGEGDPDYLQLCLRLYDSKGEVVHEISDRIFAFVPESADSPSEPRQTPIEMSDPSRQFFRAVCVRDPPFVPVKGELMNVLLRPDEVDPLSFVQTDEIVAFASRKGKPLVADVPDDFGLGPEEVESGNLPTVEEVSSNITHGRGLAAVPDQRYTLLKPAQPVRSRAIRMDRRALAVFVTAAREKLIPSADDLAELATAESDPDASWICNTYLDLFDPSDTNPDWDALRFYGSLSSDQRAKLLSGAVLPARFLNPSQMRILDELIYGANANFDDASQNVDANSDDEQLQALASQAARDRPPIEPTELAPNGLFPVAAIDVSVEAAVFALPIADEDGLALVGLGALDPWLFAQAKSGQRWDANLPPPTALPRRFRSGIERSITFQIHLTPTIFTSRTVEDRRVPTGSKLLTESDLPEDFLKEVSRGLESIKNHQAARARDGDGGKIHPQ
jgi:hypothetical protein